MTIPDNFSIESIKGKHLPTIIILLFLAMGLLVPQVSLAGGWNPVGDLENGRANHTATRLANGKVLVVGGSTGTDPSTTQLSSAELYDPATGTWTGAGNLYFARQNHTATLLPNGKVLVAGGYPRNEDTKTAEIFDPTANGGLGGWTLTAKLNLARDSHTATLLPNGKVLVAGGITFDGDTTITAGKSAEIYDPTADGGSGAWTFTSDLNTGRRNHTATLLTLIVTPEEVLVAGGTDQFDNATDSAELYHWQTGTWTATSSLNVGRHQLPATRLPSGEVLLTGGTDVNDDLLNSTELYYPGDPWYISEPGETLITARAMHTATLLPNGKVLVAGGTTATSNFSQGTEILNPFSGTWSHSGSLTTGRHSHTATLLGNGKVLVVGGVGSGNVRLNSAELYSPNYLWYAAGPPAYFAVNGHWYRAFTFSPAELEWGFNNWEYAKVQAEAMGGYLATVTSNDENNFIFNLIKQDKLWYQTDPSSNYAQGPWIGGYQDYRLDADLVLGSDDESTYYVWKSNNEQNLYATDSWKWVTGETWSYTNWSNLEPNDYPYYEDLPAWERGHQNYLHYFNRDYNPGEPSSTKWAPVWEDAALDGYYYNLGFVVEWNQKPPPLPIAGNLAPMYMLLLE